MLIERQPAYVLHVRPYRETSLLLEVLCRDLGRLGVVARGARAGRGALRAVLEPFQCLELTLFLRGELATLRAAEMAASPRFLHGTASLGGLYMNELLVRLCAREDPLPEVFDAYARALERLAAAASPAWSLRRFERDLLQALGYALQLQTESEGGEPLRAAGYYRYLPEHGPQLAPRADRDTLRGADLLALAADIEPDTAGLAALRRMMREILRVQLGGRELKSWRLLAELSPARGKSGQALRGDPR